MVHKFPALEFSTALLGSANMKKASVHVSKGIVEIKAPRSMAVSLYQRGKGECDFYSRYFHTSVLSLDQQPQFYPIPLPFSSQSPLSTIGPLLQCTQIISNHPKRQPYCDKNPCPFCRVHGFHFRTPTAFRTPKKVVLETFQLSTTQISQ